jgi:hypothetical protein
MKTTITLLVLIFSCFAEQLPELKIDLQKTKQQFYQSKHNLNAVFEFPSDGILGPGKVVILDSLIVPSGKTLTIMAGTTLLFEPNSFMRIFGRVKGTGWQNEQKPVLFDKIPYTESYSSFDNSSDTLWNGFIVEKGGSVTLDYATFSNAKNGVYCASDTISISFLCVSFSSIKDAGIILKGSPVVSNKSCFNYNYVSQDFAPSTEAPIVKADTVSTKKQPKQHLKGRLSLRIAGGVLAAGGAAAWCYYNNQTSDYANKYKKGKTTAEVDHYYSKNHSSANARNAMAIVTVLGLAGFAVSFWF